MLSRTAEAFFWIGRYAERAEYTARMASVHHQILIEGSDDEDQTETWTRILARNGDLALYLERHGAIEPRTVIEFLAIERENPNALISCVASARENARTVQDQLSSEVWHLINRFHLELQEVTRAELAERTHQVLKSVCDMGYTLQGVITSTMLHDERLAFCHLGRDIERAQQTLRLLRTPMLLESPAEPSGMAAFQACVAVLRSASAYEAFRKTYRSGPDPAKILEFMLFSDRFPRSVRFCADAMRALMPLVVSSPGPHGRSEPERLVGQLAADMEFGALSDLYGEGLDGYLEGLGDRLTALSEAIGRTFFRYADAPATPNASLPQRRKAFPAPDAPTSTVRSVIAVRHEMIYRYEGPVSDVHTILRLVPNQRYGRQRLLDVRWSLAPQGEVRQHVDAFGNQIWQVDHKHVAREIQCMVEMLVENHATYHAGGTLSLRGVPAADEDGVAGGAEYLQLTALVDASEPLMALAQRLGHDHAQSAHLAEAAMREVHARLRYQPGITHVGTTASDALALGGGVCQDYAHVMLAVCRLRGLPARYVSGYLPAEGAMHAWVEVLVADPATGRELWVAYDPTHARRADETYVTVALGRDYADVTPSSGFYTGTAGNTLQVKVTAKLTERRPIARSPGTAPLTPPAGFDLRAGQESQQQ